MSRGRRISDSVIKLIKLESLANPDMPRRALAVKLQETIERMGEPVPTEETIIKMISKTRNQTPDPQDEPWTLSASIANGFSPEFTPILLRAWKYALSLEMPFTIREGKWLIYLSHAIPDFMRLLFWAKIYASEERVHKLLELEGEFTSFDLDAVLTMSVLEYFSLSALGKTMTSPPVSWPGILRRPKPFNSYEEDAYTAASTAENSALDLLDIQDSPDDSTSHTSETESDILQPLDELGLPEELVWIYTHWLIALKKGPTWSSLQLSEALDIITKLRQWISQFIKPLTDITEYLLKVYDCTSRTEAEKLKRVRPTDFAWAPNELLHLAGYTTDTPFTSPGNWPAMLDRIVDFFYKSSKYMRKSQNSNKTKTIEEE